MNMKRHRRTYKMDPLSLIRNEPYPVQEFENDIYNLRRYGPAGEISLKDLKEFFPDFPIEFFDRNLTTTNFHGRFPAKMQRFKKKGLVYYSVKELVSFARKHSIPDEGLLSSEPIRHAEILNTEPDEKDPKTIKAVTVAAAFLQGFDQRKGLGNMIFVCPFCSSIHLHGTGPGFGGGDGWRIPHCLCRNTEFLRKDTQNLARSLADGWQFNLVETSEYKKAGQFPKKMRSELAMSAAKRRRGDS